MLSKTICGVVAAMAILATPGAGAMRLHVITFDDDVNRFVSGDPVGEIRTGAGTVLVEGQAPLNPQPNAAMIFDATCTATCNPPDPSSAAGRAARQFKRRCNRCTGGDEDLRQPEQRNVLIVSESGLAADPGDSGPGGRLSFDFQRIGTIRLESLVVIDLEADSPATARFYRGDTLLEERSLPTPGNGRCQTAALGVNGVQRLVIELEGSGAVDDLAFCVGDDPDLECQPATRVATSPCGSLEPSPPPGPRPPATRPRGTSEPAQQPAGPGVPATSGATQQPTGPGAPATSGPTQQPTGPGAPATSGPTQQPTGPGVPATSGPAQQPTGPGAPATSAPTQQPTGPSAPATSAPTQQPTGPGVPPTSGPTQQPTGPGAPASSGPAQQPTGPPAAAPGDDSAGRGAPGSPPESGQETPVKGGWPPFWIWLLLVLVAIGILLSPRLRAAKSVDYSVKSRLHRERRWISAPRFEGPDYDLDIRLRGSSDPGRHTITED